MKQSVVDYLDDRNNEVLKVIKVGKDAYAITGAIANIGIILDEHVAMIIDTGNVHVQDKILETVSQIVGDREIRYIVITHAHGDHVDNNEVFSQKACIIAHENAYEKISMRNGILWEEGNPLLPQNWPNILVQESLKTAMDEKKIEIKHFSNSHSGGDIIVFAEGNRVIYTGDIFVNGYFPFLDIEDGGCITTWLKSVDKIIQLSADDAMIIPGHGPIGSKSDLRAFRDMLSNSLNFVKSIVDSNGNLSDVLSGDFPRELEIWIRNDYNRESWLESVYNSLKS